MNKKAFNIAGDRVYSSEMANHAKYDVMIEARNRLIRDIHKHEDEALRGAVCRYFGVSDPFDAARRVSVVPLRNGARRYIESGTMKDIIRFEAPAYNYSDGKVSVSLNYTTFDNIQ